MELIIYFNTWQDYAYFVNFGFETTKKRLLDYA